ncbi:hypothetical protein EUV02_03875 [Polymorphobacter arshaanensis]|uniref:Uncharacterized protein n=1 Tax=Glacieibacterium arshaanense TaxID=2511025 RepID=A0A4Y9ER97_9SPHN|nr:hypothetical protein [Polymorphobacter arshaanensis]TFU06161.1 hypothetical protein EUV02_03875 [Polymorphobacter arshaanensis]
MEPLTTDSVLMDVRDRLARIEVKIDFAAERATKLEAAVEKHDLRLDELEEAQIAQRTFVKLVGFAATAIAGIIGMLGDRLLSALGIH